MNVFRLALAALAVALWPADSYSQDAAADFAPLVANELTEPQQRKLFAAFEVLTPLHRRVLRDRLLSIHVVEGIQANAQTMRVDPGGTEPAFRLIINARVLEETLSEFATRKERQLFQAGDSQRTVEVVAGSMDAIAFVLLHEATHIVDMVLNLTPASVPGRPIEETGEAPFARGIWETAVTPVAAYRGALLDAVYWRTGQPLDIAQARLLYEELARTPFASVYSSLANAEDLAELVAWWQVTEIYGQPYRIEVRDGDGVTHSFEPMKRPLVRARLSQLALFDSAQN
jgi:hypothetical protein